MRRNIEGKGLGNPDSSIDYEQSVTDITKAKRLIVYTILFLIVSVYFLVGTWPAAAEDLSLNATSTLDSKGVFNSINDLNTTRVITLPALGWKYYVGPETLLLFVMMFAGAIGACVFFSLGRFGSLRKAS